MLKIHFQTNVEFSLVYVTAIMLKTL